MATQKDPSLEREYIIPLRRAVMKAARYDRSRIALRTIKRFIARHMRVAERDFSKIKLDVNLNNEIWYRGRKSPPAKIKVKAVNEKIAEANVKAEKHTTKGKDPKIFRKSLKK